MTAMADEFGGEIPVGAVRADRRRGDRPRGRRDARRAPLARGADAQPRRVRARRRPARRGQGGRDVRGRGPHRAPRALARARSSRSSRTSIDALYAPLPERLRPALSEAVARRPVARRGRGSACSGSCRASTTTCCPGITERQAAYAAEVGRRARRRRRRRGRAAGQGARGRRARDARPRGARPRRPARRDAHLRARRCASRGCSPRRGCRSAWRTSSRVPAVTAEWDMGDLTYNQGIHGAQDTANAMVRAGRPFHVVTDDWRADSFRDAIGRLGARGGGGHALALAQGRRVRLRDERHGRHPLRRARAACARSARRSTRSPPGALHRAAAAVADARGARR